MAELFGWTLEHIDSLPLSAFSEFREYMTVKDGLMKAQHYLARTQKTRPSEG